MSLPWVAHLPPCPPQCQRADTTLGLSAVRRGERGGQDEPGAAGPVGLAEHTDTPTSWEGQGERGTASVHSAPGLNSVSCVRGQTSWGAARAALGLTERQARWAATGRLLFWHWVQPLSYLAALALYYCPLDQRNPAVQSSALGARLHLSEVDLAVAVVRDHPVHPRREQHFSDGF